LAHLRLPPLNLTQIKQDTVPIPVVLVSINLLVASVAEEDTARCAGHLIAALAALYGHATSWTLLAVFLHRQKISLCTQHKITNAELHERVNYYSVSNGCNSHFLR